MGQLPYQLRYSNVYVTADALGMDRALTEDEVLALLKQLSVYDCMGMIGRLSTALHVGNALSRDLQLRLAEWLTASNPDLHARLRGAIKKGQFAIFEQQLVHLARLALLHADPRPADGFTDERAGNFLACLLSVPDLLHEPQIDLRDPDQRLSWVLRHCGINRSDERLALWSTYFEVFRRIWPQIRNADSLPDADGAFRTYTGTSIEEFMAAGFSFSAGLGATDTNGLGTCAALDPDTYFASTKLQKDSWQSFLNVAAAPLEDLRQRLVDEDQTWGKTVFGSLAIDKTPLLLGPDGKVYLVNLPALDRRATYGVLHVLAEGSVNDGFDREHFTAPFGAAFQAWAEGCMRRSAARTEPQPQMIFDEPYGSKRFPRRTSDIVLRYPRDLILIEVVAGPLQARTVTRGDLTAFDRDVAKLIEKKAEQLDKRAADFLAGMTAPIGLEPDGVRAIWPVIITSTVFPNRAEVGPVVRRRLKKLGLLRGRLFRPISIISAEELAAAEGAMEEGASFLELLKGWKVSRKTGDHSFKNFLIDREPDKRRVPATHHVAMFDQASNAIIDRVLQLAE